MKDFGKKQSGFANLPQESVMKEFPKQKYGQDNDLDDTMDNIDEVCKKSESKKAKYKSYQK